MHGNDKQYKKTIQHAILTKANCVLLGGDLTPKRKKGQGLEEQVKIQTGWVRDSLSSHLLPLKKANISCFLILGNGDCISNLQVMEEQQKTGLYSIVHHRRVQLNPDFELVGYPYVSFSYSSVKDFEKYDYSHPPEHLKTLVKRRLGRCKAAGYRSNFEGIWSKADFSEEARLKESIQLDLQDPVFRTNPQKTIVLSHGPPYNSNLDITSHSEHVGSIALREYLAEVQPYLCLTGHM